MYATRTTETNRASLSRRGRTEGVRELVGRRPGPENQSRTAPISLHFLCLSYQDPFLNLSGRRLPISSRFGRGRRAGESKHPHTLLALLLLASSRRFPASAPQLYIALRTNPTGHARKKGKNTGMPPESPGRSTIPVLIRARVTRPNTNHSRRPDLTNLDSKPTVSPPRSVPN